MHHHARFSLKEIHACKLTKPTFDAFLNNEGIVLYKPWQSGARCITGVILGIRHIDTVCIPADKTSQRELKVL